MDAYYTQFGKVLEAVQSPIKVLWLPKKPLVVKESMGRDTIYGQFFAFLSGDNYIIPQTSDIQHQTSTATCCLLAMQHQTGRTSDTSLISWLKQQQDETGGFRANEVAPVPDLLSTAVALFTLRLIGKTTGWRAKLGNEHPQSASRFIEAHWLDMGSFAPTILDEYSDVEYLFYGLLALGSDYE